MLGLGNSISHASTLEDPFTWVPSDVAGLTVWHRNNTNVSVGNWKDQSGNNRHAVQSTSGNQASVDNGGLHFDGTDDYYEYSSAMNIDTNEAYTLALVYQIDDDSVKNTVFSKDANSTFFEFFDDDTLRINYVGSSIQLNGGDFAEGSINMLYVTRNTSGLHTLYESSGTSVDTATQTGIALWQNLGVRNDNDRWFNGKIYEVMVWDNVELTGQDLADLNTYLNNLVTDIS